MSAIFQGFGGLLSDREGVGRAFLRLADLAEPLGFESIWERRAPLHGLHDVSRCAAVPDVHGGTYQPREARLDGAGAAVARPGSGRRADRDARPHVERPADPRPRPGYRQGRVRRVPSRDGEPPGSSSRKRPRPSSAPWRPASWSTTASTSISRGRRSTRPRWFGTFKGRTYSATVSPESAEIMAKLGTGVLIVPQKAVAHGQGGDGTLPVHYREAIGRGTATADRRRLDVRRRGRRAGPRNRLARGWPDTGSRSSAHYEFDKPHLKSTPGYEFHGLMYDRLNKPGGMEKMIDFYVGLQPWGTPGAGVREGEVVRRPGRR